MYRCGLVDIGRTIMHYFSWIWMITDMPVPIRDCMGQVRLIKSTSASFERFWEVAGSLRTSQVD